MLDRRAIADLALGPCRLDLGTQGILPVGACTFESIGISDRRLILVHGDDVLTDHHEVRLAKAPARVVVTAPYAAPPSRFLIDGQQASRKAKRATLVFPGLFEKERFLARVRGVQASFREVGSLQHSSCRKRRLWTDLLDPARLLTCAPHTQAHPLSAMIPDGLSADASQPLTIFVGSWNVGDAAPPKRVGFTHPCTHRQTLRCAWATDWVMVCGGRLLT